MDSNLRCPYCKTNLVVCIDHQPLATGDDLDFDEQFDPEFYGTFRCRGCEKTFDAVLEIQAKNPNEHKTPNPSSGIGPVAL